MAGTAKAVTRAAGRDPFAVDEKRALEALGLLWSDAYDIAVKDGTWTASRRDTSDPDITASTPGELEAGIRADWAREGTATGYRGTFRGQAEEAGRVRREVADYLGDCPVTDDMVLIADELAANAVLHTRSRGEFFGVRCELSPGSVRVEVEDMGGPWRQRKPTAGLTVWTSWKRSPGLTDGGRRSPPMRPVLSGRGWNGDLTTPQTSLLPHVDLRG